MNDPIRGMELEDALGRFLALYRSGIADPDGLQHPAESLDTDRALEYLKRHGFLARVVRPELNSFRDPACPLLMQQTSGRWFYLLKRVRKRYRILDALGIRDVSQSPVRAQQFNAVIEVVDGLPSGSRIVRLFFRLLFRENRVLSLIVAASLGLQFMALAIPQCTRIAVDTAMPTGGSSLLFVIVVGLVLMSIGRAGIGWLREKSVLYLENQLEGLISRGFLSQLLDLPFAYISGRSLGDLLQVHAGLDSTRNYFTTRLVGASLDGSLAILYLGAMAASLGAPTLAVLLITVLIAAITFLVGRRQARIQLLEIEGRAKEQGFLADLLRGIATIKSTGAETSLVHRWLGLLTHWMRYSLMQKRLGLWNEVGLEGVRQGTSVVLLIWGGKLAIQGELTVGSLIAFLQLSSGFMGAVLGLAQAWLGFEVLRPQLQMVDEILEVDPEPRPPAIAPSQLGPVVLEDVWFRYGRELPWVFKAYNLRVEPGEKFWLQAPSGFGKSTLLRLIAGLLVPQQGSLSIGGLHPREFRSGMVYLPQTSLLYGGSVYENLSLLSGGASREKILEASRISGLDIFISVLPMNYETVLPPGGGNLSGGQRQLIALTAVMASDRPLLLLDEAFANLDGIRRNRIVNGPWFDRRTIIFASHDGAFGQHS